MPKADPLYLTPLLTARGAGPRQAEGTLSHMRGGGGGSYLGPTAERGGNGMLREPSCQRRSWPLGPASLCGHLALGCSLPELLWYADQDGACSYLLSYEHHTLLLAAAGRLGPRGPLPFHNPLTRTLPLPTSPPLHLIPATEITASRTCAFYREFHHTYMTCMHTIAFTSDMHVHVMYHVPIGT